MSASGVAFNPDAPPQHPDLHASKRKLRDVLKPSYWQKLCPALHVLDQKFMAKVLALELTGERLEDLKEQINYAGVTQVSSQELPWSVSPETLANAIITLMRYGWPPSLIMMYDEVWASIKQAELLMGKATGGNACNMDILAWYVDPNRGDVGFSPHRDRQPDDSPATFRPDGTAMYATLWLPLTDATPENSCLYVIPRDSDPGYYIGDPDDDDAPDPLTTALHNKEAYQNIRALPAPKGSATIFTHRTIHWGSKGRPGYPTPRISMSWGCADDAFEPSYFSRDQLPCPPLELRLALAGAQMIVYHERFPAPPKQLALYYQAFAAQADKFDRGYRAKVMREFVDASKEATAVATAAAANSTPAASDGTAAPGSKTAAGDGLPARGKAKKGATRSASKAEASTAAAAAAADTGRGTRKRKQQQQEQVSTEQPAVVAAAVDPAKGTRKQKKEQQDRVVSAQPAAAEVGCGSSSKMQRKKQKRDAASAVATAAATAQQRQGVTAAAAGPAEGIPFEAKQRGKQRQKQQAQSPAPPTAAAAAAAVESSEDGEDNGIDWAQVAAAARAAAKKAEQQRTKHKGKGAAAAAAAGSSDSEDGGGVCGDDSSDGDVMDLALDSMLDAALAGEDGFQDDYEDE